MPAFCEGLFFWQNQQTAVENPFTGWMGFFGLPAAMGCPDSHFLRHALHTFFLS
jgi:hypothetical protein